MSWLDSLLQTAGRFAPSVDEPFHARAVRTKHRLLEICAARFSDGVPLTGRGFFELAEDIGDHLEAHEAVLVGHEERVIQLVEELRAARERIAVLEARLR